MAKNQNTETVEATPALPPIKRKVSAPGSRRKKTNPAEKQHDFANGPAIGTITKKAKLIDTRFGERVALHLDTCFVYLPGRYYDSVSTETAVGDSVVITQVLGETSFDTVYEIGVM